MKTRFWSAISILAFVGGILFWLEGNRRQSLQPPLPPAAPGVATTQQVTQATSPASVRLLTRADTLPAAASTAPDAPVQYADAAFPLRLRNTPASVDALSRSETALLLRNALLDTASPVPLPVPDLLRASPEPGAYLVQAHGPLTPDFRARIAAQGGRVVSYIPNNAYLVRISAAGATALSANARAVLPFEPYFKLDPGLLARALELEPLPEHALVRVTAYAEDRDTVFTDLSALGAAVVAESRGTIGFEAEPQFVVAPRTVSLAALAALPGVQLIESHAERVLLNDLTRERLAVAADTVTATNYLGLTGSNVWVNINDSGIWAEHPDLKDRVFAGGTNLLEDPLGHGTHVAGIIASTGANGPTGTNVPPGSLTNATFRGLATNASLFVLGVDRTLGPLFSDLALQEVAAATNYLTLQRTNALISNNSWGYARVFEYDSAAASYDAAVRDALPGQPGSQSLLYVFAAGNEAYGNEDGSGGNPGSILSPATAKNVITVGATENLRPITYEVVATNQVTNIFEGEFFVTNVVETNTVTIRFADSDDEVAPFSGRGNVGLGIEGDNGRFKPDIVAPGVFIVSTSPTNWTVDLIMTNSTILAFPAQLVLPTEWNQYGLLVPARAARLTLSTLPAPDSPDPFPDLEIYARFGDTPTSADFRGVREATIDSPEEGPWYYSIANPTQAPVSFNLVVRLDVTVDASDYLDLLRDINEPLAPYYRYDNGTSASAAAVSGLLALMQEFFEQQIERPYSPALMKALLINGARSLSSRYNLEVRPQINYQGWGLPTLTNIFPAVLTNLVDQPEEWPVRWVDQHPTNALATAETHQYDLTIPTNTLTSDLRVTLVWTDPPGNPAASIKLVNDLDLVVSNRTTGLWYLGNDIPASSDYNRPVSTNDNVGLADNINNVENVFLRGPIDTNYTVYVTARRVNVNAVTAHTNAIAQDYALVVSVSGTNALTFTPQPLLATNLAETTVITNGVPLLYQRAGAHSPLIGTRDGTTNQWHFYVFTNEFNPALTGGDTNFGQYVAFLTFTPPNLSVPRVSEEGDIDMYVLRGSSNLVNLEPAALAASLTSLQRAGTELVTFEDAAIGEVFYVGIKSEDQMSSEYGLIGISSDQPFGELLPDGSYMMYGRPVPRLIPDGTPQSPGAALVFGIGVYPMVVGRAIAYTTTRHEEMGDLLGNLSHARRFAVLNNHSPATPAADGTVSVIFDDTGAAIEPAAVRTDGPGSLIDFIGAQASGVWQFTMIDNALGHTGQVEDLRLRVFPAPDLLAGTFVTLAPNQYDILYVDVPADAVLLRILLSQMTLPVDVFLRYDVPPTLNDFDKYARIPPPSGELTLGRSDIPPLRPGRYFVGVYNPNAQETTFYIRALIERDPAGPLRTELVGTNTVPILDDARIYLTNQVDRALQVADVNVGLRVSHPRVSDLAFSLISPEGTRTVLVENRGGTNRTALGYDEVLTNFHHVALTYRTNTGLATLYLDGVPQVQRDVGSFAPDTRHTLFFGRQPATNVAFAAQYLGQLDEVDLYGRALEAAEILGIYRYGGAAKPTNVLVSRWSFDGNGADAMGNHPAGIDGPAFVPGKFGLGLGFAAEGDLVIVTNAVGLDVGLRDGFTIDAWVNPADLSTNRILATWGDGTNHVGVEFGFRPGTLTNAPAGLLYANLRDRTGTSHVVEALTQGLIRTNAFLTNTVYVTLSDDTNRTSIPIKFAEPDTAPTGRSTNRFLSGFEGRIPGRLLRLAPDTHFEGWQVAAGHPAVLNAPLAHTGTNLLVLRDGTLLTNVATLPGRMYRLQVAHRREPLPDGLVSWWPAENTVDDIVSTNHGLAQAGLGYLPGKVGMAFGLTNAGYARVPYSPSLDFTNELSVEFWYLAEDYAPLGSSLFYKRDQADPLPRLNYLVALSQAGLDAGFNDPTVFGAGSDLPNGVEGVRLSPPPPVGVFHHLVATYRQINPTQVELALFLNGQRQRAKIIGGVLSNAVNPGPLWIGRTTFTGLMDEVTLYNRVLDDEEVEQIYWLDALGKCPPPCLPATLLRVDGTANTIFTSDPEWQTQGLTFMATQTNTLVEVAGLLPGALLDSFDLMELPATEFLAEEPLTPFKGERALGEWKLEVVDRRVGATNTLDTAFIQWQLQLTFSPLVVPAITLTNGVPYTNSIPRGQARYFIVDVPLEARRATNTLGATTPLDLWFNHTGAPTFGELATDHRLLTNRTSGIAVVVTNETRILDTNLTVIATTPLPLLEPGQRYYLALTNLTATTDFSIQVDFDAVGGTVAGVRDLARGQTITTNAPAANLLQYYRYVINTNTVAASFEVHPTNGNVQLYLRKAEPVRNPLPTPQLFDYASENPGTNAEIIVVTQDSLPVPLSAGPWYLGVLNVDPTPVTYSIRVLEYTNYVDQVLDLQENVKTIADVAPGNLSRLYFRFEVPGSPGLLQFDLTELTGRADLVARLGALPSETDYEYFDQGAPGLPARLLIQAGGLHASLNGTWFLAVYNRETSPISLGLTPTFPPAEPIVRALTDRVPLRDTIAADTLGLPQRPDLFSFTVPIGATNVTFQLTPLNGNADLLLRQGYRPDLTTFDYFSFSPGTLPEAIVVDATSSPVPLVPGEWFLAVYNNALFSTTYDVLVTSLPAGLTGEISLVPTVEIQDGTLIVRLRWSAPPGLGFLVQYATAIPTDGPIPWITLPGVVTSLGTDYEFVDDGSQTGGSAPFKIYRVFQSP